MDFEVAFDILWNSFWLFLIAFVCSESRAWRRRGTKRFPNDPERIAGYRKLSRGLAAWGSLPWLVMGLGITLGSGMTLDNYFEPETGNVWSMAYFGSWFILYSAGTFWILARHGAEKLKQHPGLLHWEFSYPTLTKLVWCCAVAVGTYLVIAG